MRRLEHRIEALSARARLEGEHRAVGKHTVHREAVAPEVVPRHVPRRIEKQRRQEKQEGHVWGKPHRRQFWDQADRKPRHDKKNGQRYATPVDVEFTDIQIETGQKKSQ